MSYTITKINDPEYIHTRWEGKITMVIVQNYLKELSEVLTKSNSTQMLSDFRDTEILLTSFDIMKIPKLWEATSGLNKLTRAIIASPDTSGYEMFETLSIQRHQSIRLFYEPNEALNWLLSSNTKDHCCNSCR